MGDFFAFRRMLAPVLIHIFFWLGVIAFIGAGVAVLIGKTDMVIDQGGLPGSAKQHVNEFLEGSKLYVGLALCILGPFLLRLYCELIMLPFRMNGTLTDIRNTLQARESQHTGAPVHGRL
jgi:hypothetical protein